jgi:outer membrane protein OmpA-like peptidoglycan-associated protein
MIAEEYYKKGNTSIVTRAPINSAKNEGIPFSAVGLGHANNVGDDSSNMKLSHGRAQSVGDYKVTQAFLPPPYPIQGVRRTEPGAANDTDDGLKTNCKTEFIIIEF